MKFYTILKLLLFIFLFSSCNTEEKERERKRNLETIQEEDQFDKFIAQYEPLYFDNTSLNYKFSYELEQVYLNKNIAYSATINDITKINDDKYILHAIGKNKHLKNAVLKLELNKKLVEKISRYRTQFLNSEDQDEYSKWRFRHSHFIFIIKPYAINKDFGVYKYVNDYSVEENELYDYTIDLEIDNGNFIINAKCLDLMLADRIFYTLEEKLKQ